MKEGGGGGGDTRNPLNPSAGWRAPPLFWSLALRGGERAQGAPALRELPRYRRGAAAGEHSLWRGCGLRPHGEQEYDSYLLTVSKRDANYSIAFQ